MRRVLPLAAVALSVAGCVGAHPWAPGQPPPRVANPVPSDVRVMYRAMGLLSDTAGLRFIGSLRYLAGPTPDSTLAVFAVSLANRAVRFMPEGSGFAASYSVELEFRAHGAMVRDVVREETVRVSSARETLRADESIVFQEFVSIPPGAYTVNAVVRDRNSPVDASVEVVDTIPRFSGPSLGQPIAIYEGAGRAGLAAVPTIVVNPRSTLRAGTDSLRVYVEGYGLRRGTQIVARVIDLDSVELWRDTMATSGDSTMARATVLIEPGTLPLGRAQLVVDAVGAPAHTAGPLLVGFSDRWAVTGFDQMVTVLRFFPRQDLVAALRAAPKDQRAAAWRTFYRASDPDPMTPQNEALDHHLQRLEKANERFAEAGSLGWQTDRGEVYITLGEPDREFDVPGSLPGLRWEYDHPHLTLWFRDDTGLGQLHLTLESRADFDRAAATIRTPGHETPVTPSGR